VKEANFFVRRKIIVLKNLKLKNVVLIEIIEINFEKGLNVFTGESGSGKSLILDSLNSLFGGSNIPPNQLIRPEKTECLIEAVFHCDNKLKYWLDAHGVKNISDEISVVKNSYKTKDKVVSKYKVNNFPITKKFIELLGIQLLDFAGQADTQLFSSPDYLKTIIDELGSTELQQINQEVKSCCEEYQNLLEDLKRKTLLLEKAKEDQFANTQILKIIEEANLSDGDEINELKSKQISLSNNLELSNSIQSALIDLSDGDEHSVSVNNLIANAIKNLSKVANFDSKITNVIDELTLMQENFEKISYSLSKSLQLTGNEETILGEVQKRLFDLQTLEKNFSLNIADLIIKRDELRLLSNSELQEKELIILNEKINDKKDEFDNILKIQSTKRKEIAKVLEQDLISLLNKLGLENSLFRIEFTKTLPNSRGCENIDFLFSANPDLPLVPIHKVISGGEMSRFLLALKSCISVVPGTLFFDEIDNGLSGKSLFFLINLIKNISKGKQILCITHNPLLAASANGHFKVEKKFNEGLTYTTSSKLVTKKQRQNQLVELIGGRHSEASDYALTLINNAAA
tara:strand:- start:246 stop:1964 length:1719 start_codon:yes stop_codon:yes gene_type:complete